MIDYFKLYTNNLNLIDLDFLEDNIEDFKRVEDGGFIKYTGTKENISFLINDHGMFIKGSPATYYYGTNIKTLKHADLKGFIEKLSCDLNCDIKQFKVSRIDLTDNLEMEHSPILYKNYMGKCEYLQRVADYEYNGLIYRNKSRDVLLYDKTIEMNAERKPIPIEYQNKNLWRYEYRIKKKMHKYMNSYFINGIDDLLRPDDFRNLVDVWEQMFKTIELINVDSLHQLPYNYTMNYEKYLMASGIIASGGIANVMQDLKEQSKVYTLPMREYYRKLKKYKSVMEYYHKEYQLPVSLNDELILKLELKAEENRMMI